MWISLRGKGVKKGKVIGWLHQNMHIEYPAYECSNIYCAELRQIIMIIPNKRIIYINLLGISHERSWHCLKYVTVSFLISFCKIDKEWESSPYLGYSKI